MEGAIDSLAEYGVAGTTVRTISAAAGVSTGLIAHYYDSKEDLLAAALRHLFSQVSGVVSAATERSGPSAVGRLKAVPSAMFSPPVFTDRNRNAFLSLWHEIRFNKAVRKANEELYLDYIQRTEAMFRDAAAERKVPIDAREAAIGFIGLSDGLWLGQSIHDRITSADQAIAICHHYIERQLGCA